MSEIIEYSGGGFVGDLFRECLKLATPDRRENRGVILTDAKTEALRLMTPEMREQAAMAYVDTKLARMIGDQINQFHAFFRRAEESPTFTFLQEIPTGARIPLLGNDVIPWHCAGIDEMAEFGERRIVGLTKAGEEINLLLESTRKSLKRFAQWMVGGKTLGALRDEL